LDGKALKHTAKKRAWAFLPYLLFVFYKLLRWSWRVEVRESEGLKKLVAENKMFVVAHWHGEELGIVYLLKPYHVSCMVSHSFDGEMIARVIEMLGSKTVRGSSSTGAVGVLKGILRLAKEGWRPSVAVDGPRGPRHEVKSGVIEIARVVKAPIVSINMASSNPFIFKKSWNKSELPLPFSKIVVVWGEPIEVDAANGLDFYKPLVADSLHSGRKICRNAVGLD